ncbi:dihydrolipoamide acetyltransferase family protein [Streptomyces sp. B6B3]|uniref:dihydrolipoamide acetyltransferase family protein n=1 Tax=Streptomyces sp. B6B3 TaxID=3153570 RepID=UPI00325DBFA3
MSTTVAEVGERLFRLPDLGEGLEGAEVVAWRVAVGDTVTVDQVVVEVETAKVAVEVPIPFPGVVLRLHADVGASLAVGEPLISVGQPGGAATAAPAPHAVRGNGAAPGEPSGANAEPAEPPEPDTGSGSVLVGYGTGPAAPPRRGRRGSATAGRPAAAKAADAANASGGGAGADSAVRAGTAGDGTGAGAALTADAGAVAAADVRTGVGGSAAPAAGSPAGTGARGSAGTGAGPAGAGTAAGGAPALVGGAAGPESTAAGSGGVPRVISPLVRRLAREHGIDVGRLTPSGPERIVLRRDVERAVAARDRAGSASASEPADERVPLRGLRLAVAEKVSRSRTEIPDATTWVDVDASDLVAARDALRAAEPSRPVGLLALLARICVAGLRRFPELNATVDTERGEIVRIARVHLGFAAQTERGLVVPVVRDAHRRTTAELAAELARLTELARTGGLSPADLTGGTFTLNNYGVFGVDGSTPIINHPEAGMLGVGRIIDRPWVVDGALAVRKVTQLSLSFDHRVCDGGAAGGFLRFVADRVEHPAILLADL